MSDALTSIHSSLYTTIYHRIVAYSLQNVLQSRIQFFPVLLIFYHIDVIIKFRQFSLFSACTPASGRPLFQSPSLVCDDSISKYHRTTPGERSGFSATWWAENKRIIRYVALLFAVTVCVCVCVTAFFLRLSCVRSSYRMRLACTFRARSRFRLLILSHCIIDVNR